MEKEGPFDPAVRRVLATLAVVVVYVLLCLAPLVIIPLGHPAVERPLLIKYSIRLGYVGLVMLTLQFAVASRIRWLSSLVGLDVLLRFHREVSYLAMAFVFAHPALLLIQNVRLYLPLFDVRTSPWRGRLGVAALAALVLVVVLSVWRRKLRISYEAWRLTHRVLSLAVIFLALGHMIGVNDYSSGLGGRLVIALVVLAVLGLVLWSRVIEPRLYLLRPWRVVQLVPEHGGAVTLVLEPEGHPGWSFMPGQFAWLTLATARFQVRHQHPFSLSSPGDVEPGGSVTMTIKSLGDWTQTVSQIEPGTRVFLDGPHGSFSIDLDQGHGFVLIAGGVGIAPLYSMVATMCVREDMRPVVLFYANPDWESVTFRDQLDELRQYMPNLRIVHVLKSPPPGWTGEQGRVTPELLRRHLPRHFESFEYFLCASEGMMESVEAALQELGVATDHVHAERFAMV